MGNLQKRPAGPGPGERPGARGQESRGRPHGRAPQAPAAPEPRAPQNPEAPEPRDPQSPAADPAGLQRAGNELFARGQFAQAAARYSEAIAQLEPAGRRGARRDRAARAGDPHPPPGPPPASEPHCPAPPCTALPGTRNAEELSILYANRAACHLKDGDCRDCVQDCSR